MVPKEQRDTNLCFKSQLAVDLGIIQEYQPQLSLLREKAKPHQKTVDNVHKTAETQK